MPLFAERLKKAMEDRGLNQTELSRISGIGKSHISQYLSGVNIPREDKKQRLEAALETSFDEMPAMSDELIKFSTKPITLKTAARVMHMDQSKLADEMEAGRINIGKVFRTEGSKKRSFYVSPKLFYELTGWHQ